MSNWNKIFKPIVVLVIICIVVTGALAATNGVTAPIITAGHPRGRAGGPLRAAA